MCIRVWSRSCRDVGWGHDMKTPMKRATETWTSIYKHTNIQSIVHAYLDEKLKEHVQPVDATLEGVVWGRHQIKHPCEWEIGHQNNKSLRLREVSGDSFPIFVGLSISLDAFGTKEAVLNPQKMINEYEDLPHRHRQQSQTQPNRVWPDMLGRIFWLECRIHFPSNCACLMQWTRANECVCVCVCERERERERENYCACVTQLAKVNEAEGIQVCNLKVDQNLEEIRW